MTFALQSAFTDNVSTIPASVLNAWRVDINRALDGVNGGTYTLLVPLEIAGEELVLDELKVTLISGPGDTTIDEDVHMVWSFGSYLEVEAGAFVEFDGSVDASGSFEFKSGADVEVESGASFDVQAGATWLSGAKLSATAPNDWTPVVEQLNAPSGGRSTFAEVLAAGAGTKARILAESTGPGLEFTVNAAVDTDGSNYTRDVTSTAASLRLIRNGNMVLQVADSGSGDFTSYDRAIGISPTDDPSSPIANYLYPGLIPKAFGRVTIASGAPTLATHFNVSGISTPGGGVVRVEIGTNLSSSAYTVIVSAAANALHTYAAVIDDAGAFFVYSYDPDLASEDMADVGYSGAFAFVVFGFQ